ncbi:MAG: winged helix-turn-helix domain-containing protein [Paraglaciecola sp.]|uniref:winged helix-turn-helix domain-containing tetratricopeptide repeat protein n=1 Tax=Paraglaciecola sp. TaxID=1920173 RepID=UPI003299BD27
MELRSYDFKIGDWYVSISECSLSSDTEVLHIEPKAMEVLEMLAQAQGELVSRGAIMEKIWHGRHVTDYALNNVIASLRKYLDAENKNKYIVTRPKRGYQLNCDLVWAPTKVDPIYSNSTIITSPDLVVQQAIINEPNNEKIKQTKQRSWILTVCLLLLITISIFSSIYPTKSSDNPQPILEKKSVAVLPFKVVTDTPEIAYLAKGLANELITQLGGNHNIFVYDRRSSFGLVDQKPDSRDPKVVSDMLGANYVLDGAVSKVNEQTTINVTLYDELGVDLWSADFNVNSDSIFVLQDDIIRAVYTALDSKPLVQTEAGQYYRSANPNAFQHLLQGRALNGKGSLEAHQQAIIHFKMAIEFDPNYASAYVDLATGYLVLFSHRNLSLEDANIKAKPLIDKALSLHPKLPSAISAQGIFAMYNGQTNKAIGYFSKALTLDPSLIVARTNIAYLYKTQMQYEEALSHYKAAKKQHPLDPGINYSIARILLETGQLSASYAALETCVRVSTNSTNCPLELAFLQRLVGQPEAAGKTFEALLDWYQKEDDFYIIQNKGFHAWWDQDLMLALVYFENLHEKHQAQYNFLPSLAWLKWQQGDTNNFYQDLSRQSQLDEAFNTEYQLRALAILAYALEDCDGMFNYYQQLADVKPLVHGQFSEIIEGFSMTLNMAACHIREQKLQLAIPLINKVAESLDKADELAKQAPGVVLIEAKLDSLKGKTIDTATLKARFASSQFPHSWMLEKDWAFKLKQ